MNRAILIGAGSALLIAALLAAALWLGLVPVLNRTLGIGPQVTEEAANEQPEKPEVIPFYLALDPPFVINFTHQGTLRYLQLDIQLMASEQETLTRVQSHLPAIRNDIILYLSEQTFENLAPAAGKEKLREDIKGIVNRNIARRKMPGIDQVYFTSFVMQ